MNTFFLIITVLVSIIVLLLIIALFTKKAYNVRREITINKPNSVVFDYIKHIKNQDYFSKWVMTDPNMEKIYKGTDGTVGFIYGWNGNKQAGEGEQEIRNIIEGEKLDLEVRFVRPFEAVAHTPFYTESVLDNQTKLSWGMSSAMKYPMNIMLWFLDFDKLLGKDMEISLDNLKSILEQE
jgi:hypothetical protein